MQHLNLIMAVLLGLLGLTQGLRHIMLTPTHLRYPTEPLYVRVILFTMALSSAATAVIFWQERNSPTPYAGHAAPALAFLLVVMVVYSIVSTVRLYAGRAARRPPQVVNLAPVPRQAA